MNVGGILGYLKSVWRGGIKKISIKPRFTFVAKDVSNNQNRKLYV